MKTEQNDKVAADEIRVEFTRTDADVDNAFWSGYATASRNAVIGAMVGGLIGAGVKYVQDRRHPVRAWARRVIG